MISIPNDPIILSLAIGTLALVISIITLALSKPKMVQKVSEDNQKKLDWFKLIIVSILINITVSICTFLLLVQDRTVEYSDKLVKHANY